MPDVKQNPNSQIPNSNDTRLTGQVSGGSKEVEKPVSDYVKSSATAETAPRVEQNLQDIGVESHTEQPDLDSTHELIGIKHAPSDTPFKPGKESNIQLPMSESQAKNVMAEYKNKVTYDIGEHGEHDAYVVPSKLGLATLVDKINKFLDFFRIKKRQTV